MTKDDRYQYQTRLVKLYRWLRWKPYYFIRSLCTVTVWLLTGTIPPVDADYYSTRKEYLKFIWRITFTYSDIRMKHMYTMDEVMDNIRKRIK